MNTNEDRMLESDIFASETYQIIGAAIEVSNVLGSGLLEKPYENALACELRQRGISFVQQPRYEVDYKGQKVGEYLPDLVVADNVIVELKVVQNISNVERAQMINYLKITGLRVGLIFNFSKPKLEWERVIL